jgi:hypothetical protein
LAWLVDIHTESGIKSFGAIGQTVNRQQCFKWGPRLSAVTVYEHGADAYKCNIGINILYSMDMDIQHRHGHMDMDMQDGHGHGHAGWTLTCSIDMDSSLDMDMKH